MTDWHEPSRTKKKKKPRRRRSPVKLILFYLFTSFHRPAGALLPPRLPRLPRRPIRDRLPPRTKWRPRGWANAKAMSSGRYLSRHENVSLIWRRYYTKQARNGGRPRPGSGAPAPADAGEDAAAVAASANAASDSSCSHSIRKRL